MPRDHDCQPLFMAAVYLTPLIVIFSSTFYCIIWYEHMVRFEIFAMFSELVIQQMNLKYDENTLNICLP